MRPQVGQKVYYSNKGMGSYYMMNGRWPARQGYLGKVISVGSDDFTVATQMGNERKRISDFFVFV